MTRITSLFTVRGQKGVAAALQGCMQSIRQSTLITKTEQQIFL